MEIFTKNTTHSEISQFSNMTNKHKCNQDKKKKAHPSSTEDPRYNFDIIRIFVVGWLLVLVRP